MAKPLTVGIAAANIRAGGGVTHLRELLAAADLNPSEIVRVRVYGVAETLAKLPERPWLDRKIVTGSSSSRFGHTMALGGEIWGRRDRSDDILLVPGGSYLGGFRPYVAFAQNLLPFDRMERTRLGLSFKRLRLSLLRKIQSLTFLRASGVVFMSAISRAQIQSSLSLSLRHTKVINHGIGSRFRVKSRVIRENGAFNPASPYRLLYVSIIDDYKHQDIVIASVAELRARGFPITLDLIGPAVDGYREKIVTQLRACDPDSSFIRYRGPLGYEDIHRAYDNADAFVFASSCETFGIILLEAMAAGLPIICSHRSSMPEIVDNAAIYFDPLDKDSLSRAILATYNNCGLRRALSFSSLDRVEGFSWKRCADETFAFTVECYARECQSQRRSK